MHKDRVCRRGADCAFIFYSVAIGGWPFETSPNDRYPTLPSISFLTSTRRLVTGRCVFGYHRCFLNTEQRVSGKMTLPEGHHDMRERLSFLK